MNQIVQSWNRSISRPKYDGPDALEIEGQKIQVEESEEMAERKSPQVLPVLDNSFGDEKEKKVIVLSKSKFNSIIRLIKKSSISRVRSIRTVTWVALKRLQVKRDLTKAVKGTPKGSSQGDVGSIRDWTNKVTGNHRKAVAQIIAIDATCCARDV